VALIDQRLLNGLDAALGGSEDEHVELDEVFMVKALASHLNEVEALSLKCSKHICSLDLVSFVV